MLDLSKRLVLLDRDGVLNEDLGDYVTSIDELILIPSALRALAQLTDANIRIGICTNQAGIARGRYSRETLAHIHKHLCDEVKKKGGHIHHIIFCDTYDSNDPRRKPNPGMLIEQANYFQVDLSGIPFVGDSYTDILAARAADAQPVLVQTGKGKQTFSTYQKTLTDVLIYPTLEEAVKQWLTS
ncbi:D-glycero-alpha-D-manno-heptose-1,7-bisphosphate 7-phosphatase [Suttonella ornithocola]|uniref:D,D-heptose 1,7-bisphosphate phosphatase n=1 Tax=Suttonella ornithocola TaxID=279832 RepID=A0A380MKB8_9GAMM|nr:HAD-IIIA family hydrolase [Suttonella ornithocola]SUO93085.1 D,D-heptose 1,7-bisphosphate phosphatase [Suttonella ornithocola]